MTTARDYLAAVQQRADAATPAPWDRDDRRNDGRVGVRSTAPDMGPLRGSDEVCEVGDESMPLVDQDVEFIAASRTDVPRLVAALTAALDLHREEVSCGNPGHTNLDVGCPECLVVCDSCGEVYPCPTVRAITAELTAKESDS